MKQGATDTFHIFGRKSYSQPLELVDIVTIPQGRRPELPEGPDWVEVIAIPQAAIIRVIPRPKERRS